MRASMIIAPKRFRTIAILSALLLLSACASTPKTTPSHAPLADRIVNYALSLEGAPYLYGKSSPEEGFDCSGFVWHVYQHNGIPVPRTTEQMALLLPEVDENGRKAGDLLFFQTGDKPYSHVALYLGNETFIHAPSSNTGQVMISGLDKPYWRQRLAGVRRPLLNR